MISIVESKENGLKTSKFSPPAGEVIRSDDITRFILHLFAMPVKLSADTRKIYEITIVRYMLLMRIQSQMAQRIPMNFLIPTME